MRTPLDAQLPNIECVECRAIAGSIVLRAYNRCRGAVNGPAVTIHVGWQETVTDQLQWHGARRGHVGFQEKLNGARVRVAVHHFVLFERVDADSVSVDQPEVACR